MEFRSNLNKKSVKVSSITVSFIMQQKKKKDVHKNNACIIENFGKTCVHRLLFRRVGPCDGMTTYWSAVSGCQCHFLIDCGACPFLSFQTLLWRLCRTREKRSNNFVSAKAWYACTATAFDHNHSLFFFLLSYSNMKRKNQSNAVNGNKKSAAPHTPDKAGAAVASSDANTYVDSKQTRN